VVDIFPFCGVLYNKKRVKKLSNVLSPPYDVIKDEEQEFLYNLSDFNMVRLILGKDFPGDNEYNNKYVRAASSFNGWIRHGILSVEEKPSLYVYEQQFKYGTKTYSRTGIIALLRFDDVSKRKVVPHEFTLPTPKRDRISLIRSASANFDNVFSLFSDEKGKISKIMKKMKKGKPELDVKDVKGIINRLWKVKKRSEIKKIQKYFKDKTVFIADGHHRYEAALQFKNEMKVRNTRFTEEEAYNHVMMDFVPIQSLGLVVLPIHRVLKIPLQFSAQYVLTQLEAYFDIFEYPFKKKSEDKIKKKMTKELQKKSNEHAFCFYFKEIPDTYYILALKKDVIIHDIIKEDKSDNWKNLDVTILHSLVFKNLLGIEDNENFIFTKHQEEALNYVKDQNASLAVLLNPVKVEDIIKIAEKFEKMPQKSTYFYPKLTSGVIMNRIILGEKIE